LKAINQIFIFVFAIIMFIIRAVVIGFFISKFRDFQGFYNDYRQNLTSTMSAVQATQMSNEYILATLSSIGELVVVIAAVLVIEAAYRGSRRINVSKEQ
jgi:hypothetical protein